MNDSKIEKKLESVNLEVSKEDMEKFRNYKNFELIELAKKRKIWHIASYYHIHPSEVFLCRAEQVYNN